MEDKPSLADINAAGEEAPSPEPPSGEGSPDSTSGALQPAEEEQTSVRAEETTDQMEASLEPAAQDAEPLPAALAESQEPPESMEVVLPELAAIGEAESPVEGVAPAPAETAQPSSPPTEAARHTVTSRQLAPAYVTRTQALGMAVASGGIAFVLAIVAMIFLLVAVNGGLQFVRPTAFNRLSGQVQALNTQASTLQDSLVGVDSRLDALEKMSTQVAALQSQTSQITKDLQASKNQVESLSTQLDSLSQDVDQAVKQAEDLGKQVEQIGLQVDALQTRTNRFQTFLDGLRDLVGKLFVP